MIKDLPGRCITGHCHRWLDGCGKAGQCKNSKALSLSKEEAKKKASGSFGDGHHPLIYVPSFRRFCCHIYRNDLLPSVVYMYMREVYTS
jgi:hypothetical protein